MGSSGTSRSLLASTGFVVVVVFAVFFWNYTSLQSPMNEVLADDPRNEGISVKAHFGSYLQPSLLVFDLQEVSGDKSPTDVFRVLLQFAAAVQEHRFETVQLSYHGEVKFLLRGDYFRLLGEEYDTQNPVYTMRTFAENLLLPNGERAYGTWAGGLLGILGKQMEDFSDFHHKWYVGSLSSS